MKVIYTVLAIIYIINRTRLINNYNMYYHGWYKNTFSYYIGCFITSMIEGVCWWYIINHYIV